MLQLQDLHAYYGKSHVLHGVSFAVGAGEIVALLGRNGSGRSTTAKAIMGLVHAEGTLRWKDRDIFPTLTVRQNLLLGQKAARASGRWKADDMYELFPRLKERADTQAGVLSGGEQQMLTLCRTLMGDPALVMIDEPTEGLAPKIVEQVAGLFREIKRRGVSILLVEQKLAITLDISERLYVMGHGQIVFEGTPADLEANAQVRRDWLEV